MMSSKWLLLLAIMAPCVGRLPAQQAGVLGQWQEPGGSVIEVFRCNSDVCAKIVALSPQAPSHVDGKNPDPAQRNRTLCGLQIGYGFHLDDPAHAEDGKLYDPKSGKTYRGSLTLEDGKLHLRGYIGVKAFGRTEVWSRADGNVHCTA